MVMISTSSPCISIVIPAYNAAPYLAATIDSVVNQTFDQWELVVVDDGSTDTTATIADSYAKRDPRIRVIHQSNGGVAVARNTGFTESCPSSNYVAFLDNDDAWEPNALELLSSELDRQPICVAAHGLHRYIDASGAACREGEGQNYARGRRALVGGSVRPWPLSRPTTLAVMSFWNVIISPGVLLIRRSALERTAPFDQTMAPCDDWDMYCRLCLQGDFAFIDALVLNYRVHDANVSNARRRLERAEQRVRRKLIGLPGTTKAQHFSFVLGAQAAKRDLLSRRRAWFFHALRRHDWRNAARQAYYAIRDR